MFLYYISEFEIWKNIRTLILKLYYAKVLLKRTQISTPIISDFKLWVNVRINQELQEILMQVDLEKCNTMKKAASLKVCPQVSYL